MSLKIRYENAAALFIMGGLLSGFFLLCVSLGNVSRPELEQHPFIIYWGTMLAIMIGGFILSLLLVLYNTVYYLVKKKNIPVWELLKILFWGVLVSACVCGAGMALVWPHKQPTPTAVPATLK